MSMNNTDTSGYSGVSVLLSTPKLKKFNIKTLYQKIGLYYFGRRIARFDHF